MIVFVLCKGVTLTRRSQWVHKLCRKGSAVFFFFFQGQAVNSLIISPPIYCDVTKWRLSYQKSSLLLKSYTFYNKMFEKITIVYTISPDQFSTNQVSSTIHNMATDKKPIFTLLSFCVILSPDLQATFIFFKLCFNASLVLHGSCELSLN